MVVWWLEPRLQSELALEATGALDLVLLSRRSHKSTIVMAMKWYTYTFYVYCKHLLCMYDVHDHGCTKL